MSTEGEPLAAYTATWAPRDGLWVLTVKDSGGTVVREVRTALPSSGGRPGPEHVLQAGFGGFPGGEWAEDPLHEGTWVRPVCPVSRACAAVLEREAAERGN
jgi:hypothetical protein